MIIWISLENDNLWTFLCVPLTATALMCPKRFSSVQTSRVAAPMISNKSLFTSLEQAALSSNRISSVVVRFVIVL